jgi:hypothetical protein
VGGGESRSGQENPLDRRVREGSSPSARTIQSSVCRRFETEKIIFHLISTRQEFDDSKFAADQLRYQKRQEAKLHAKA